MEGLLLTILMAVSIGFLLIFFLALSKKRKTCLLSLFSEKKLTPEQFQKACTLIVEGMKLEIEEISSSEDQKLDIIAHNPTPFTGGKYLVHCLYAPSDHVIGSAEILELSNLIIQERLSKGIFMTTGKFTHDIGSIGELAPIEFVDGKKFMGLLEKHAPDYWVILS